MIVIWKFLPNFDYFGINVICKNSPICRDHASDVLRRRSYISLLKSHEIWFSSV